jgi:proteasome lid subunit RPN8/RPN11
MAGPAYLSIPDKECSKMKAHVLSVYPQEACGLMAGLGVEIRVIIPVTNRLHSTQAYFMDPPGLFSGLNRIDSLGMELLGVYHSHPAGPAEPSLTDRNEVIGPEMVYVICAPDPEGKGLAEQANRIAWQVRGFLINRDQITEIELDCG